MNAANNPNIDHVVEMKDSLRRSLLAHLQVSAPRIPLVAASIAIRCRNETWAGVLTEAGEQTGAPVHVDSRFLIQSLTKSFIAVVALRLVASGELALDAPLSRWLPTIPNAGRATIRQCLQHTSGFPDYGSLSEYHEAVRQGAKPWSFAQFLERTQAEKLLFEPGHGWRYSNIGYMILRRLIETVHSLDFADAITVEVCAPLGLNGTTVIKDQNDLQHLTSGYSTYLTSGGSPIDIRDTYDPGWIATGVVASTASDIVCFYHKLFSGTLLPSRLLQEMCSVVRAVPSHPRFVTPSYGLGLMADLDSPYGRHVWAQRRGTRLFRVSLSRRIFSSGTSNGRSVREHRESGGCRNDGVSCNPGACRRQK